MPGEHPPENVGKGQGVGESFNCGINEILLHRYIYGSVTAAEEREVQSHLANCKLCLDEVIAITKVLQQPVTEEEKAAFRKVVAINPETRLEKVMAKVNEMFPPETEEDDDDEKAPVWERLKIWWEAREPVPCYALALSVLIIGTFASLFTYQVVLKNDVENYYVYDDKVPYEYDVASLRGTSEGLEADDLFRSFVSGFKLGMGDYMIRNYQSAISTFEELEPDAVKLRARPPNKELIPWIRDFYFYNGVSHLALLRSKRPELNQSARSRHAEEAIQSLMQADLLVLSNNLEGSDREAYFLGLAYGFGGKQDSAIVRLQQIQPGSRFYENSDKLIHEWSNK